MRNRKNQFDSVIKELKESNLKYYREDDQSGEEESQKLLSAKSETNVFTNVSTQIEHDTFSNTSERYFPRRRNHSLTYDDLVHNNPLNLLQRLKQRSSSSMNSNTKSVMSGFSFVNRSDDATSIMSEMVPSYSFTNTNDINEEFLNKKLPDAYKAWKTEDLYQTPIFLILTVSMPYLTEKNSTGIRSMIAFILLWKIFCASMMRRTENLKHAMYIKFTNSLVTGLVLAMMTLFQNHIGPSTIFITFLKYWYTHSLFPPRHIFLVALGLSFTEVAFTALRFFRSPVAPNFESNCLRHESTNGFEYAEGPHCVQQLLAIGFYYVIVNLIGLSLSISLSQHSLRLFIKSRELHREIKINQDALEESNRLAVSILPKELWDQLQNTDDDGLYTISSAFKEGKLIYNYKDTTILFGDIVGFTPLSASMSASKLVRLLDSVFKQFDNFVEELGLEKIKTIGDCYMICAGIPHPVENGELKMLKMAKKMIRTVEKISKSTGLKLQMRIGVHCGKCFGGVLGLEKLKFDVWSRDVSIASRMESTGKPNRIQVSKELADKTSMFCLFSKEVDTSQSTLIEAYFFEKFYDKAIEILTVKDELASIAPPLTHDILKSSKISLNANAKVDLVKESSANRDEELVNSIKSSVKKLIHPRTNKFRDEAMEKQYQQHYRQSQLDYIFWTIALTLTISVLTLIYQTILSNGNSPFSYAAILPVILNSFFLYSLLKSSEVVLDNIQYLVIPVILTYFTASTLQLNNLHEVSYQYHFVEMQILSYMALLFSGSSYYVIGITNLATLIVFTSYQFFYAHPFLFPSRLQWGVTSVVLMYFTTSSQNTKAKERELQLRQAYLDGHLMNEKREQTMRIRGRINDLMDKIVPYDVVQRWKSNPNKLIADQIDDASVIFVYIDVEILSKEEKIDEDEEGHKIIWWINEIYTHFDTLIKDFGIEKVKSLGTIYMAMTHDDVYTDDEGDSSTGASHYIRMANFALALRSYLQNLNKINEKELFVKFQIGIQVGPIVAGVIGTRKISYDIWGDTVNTASRLESTCETGKIHICKSLAQILENTFEVTERGMTFLKGKGNILTFYLEKNIEIQYHDESD